MLRHDMLALTIASVGVFAGTVLPPWGTTRPRALRSIAGKVYSSPSFVCTVTVHRLELVLGEVIAVFI
jgi:hypothetical protein